MKYRTLCLSLLLFVGGNGCSSRNNLDVENIKQVQAASDVCSTEPTATLASSNVEAISFDRDAIATSGIVSSSRHLGYTFNAQSGQKLQYQTEDDICLWLYSPENKLVTTTELPATGKYTLQVAAPQGSKSFDLKIGFKTEQAAPTEENNPASKATTTPTREKVSTSKARSNPTFRFRQADFPKSLCGDPKPSDSRDYPVNFYPVQVPYSDRNLSIARSYFCEDSFPKVSQDTGEKVVQISSFTSKQKARDFGAFISPQLSDVQIGTPTIIYE